MDASTRISMNDLVNAARALESGLNGAVCTCAVNVQTVLTAPIVCAITNVVKRFDCREYQDEKLSCGANIIGFVTAASARNVAESAAQNVQPAGQVQAECSIAPADPPEMLRALVEGLANSLLDAASRSSDAYWIITKEEVAHVNALFKFIAALKGPHMFAGLQSRVVGTLLLARSRYLDIERRSMGTGTGTGAADSRALNLDASRLSAAAASISQTIYQHVVIKYFCCDLLYRRASSSDTPVRSADAGSIQSEDGGDSGDGGSGGGGNGGGGGGGGGGSDHGGDDQDDASDDSDLDDRGPGKFSDGDVVVKQHNTMARRIVTFPDGRVATGGEDGHVRVFGRTCRTSPTDQLPCVATLTGHQGEVMALALLRDGHLISGGNDKTVRVWRQRDPGSLDSAWECVAVLVKHSGSITSLVELSDGRVVSGSADNTLRVWRRPGFESGSDCTSGLAPPLRTCSVVLEGHTKPITAIAVLPNGDILSASMDKTMRVWREADNSPSADSKWQCAATLIVNDGYATAMAVMPDGHLVCGWSCGSMRVWRYDSDPASWKAQLVHGVHEMRTSALAVAPDGSLVTGGNRKAVRVWRRSDPTSSSSPLQCVAVWEGHNASVTSIAVQADGRVVSGSMDRTVRVWPVPLVSC